jgi:hypothetical protein
VQLNTQQERWRMRKEGGNGSLSSCCWRVERCLMFGCNWELGYITWRRC